MDKLIKAKYRSVEFENNHRRNTVLFYACVRTPLRTHTYFIVDLWKSKCHVIEVSNLYTLQNYYRCLKAVARNNYREYQAFALLRTLFQDGIYDLKLFGLLGAANIPHYAIHIGDKRFWIGNLGTHNALICDLENQRVTSFTPTTEDDLLGPQVSYDNRTDEVFFTSYGLKGHLRIGSAEPGLKNRFTLKKYNIKTQQIDTVWSDDINCLLIDGLRVTTDQRYAIFSDLRFAINAAGQFDPSSIYIADLQDGKSWEIPNLKASAHIQPDPDDPHIFYASEHQLGLIIRDKITDADLARNKDLTFFKKLKFFTKEVGGVVGVAAILKYRITSDGPELLGTFRDGKDFVRATWHFVFKNKGKKYIGSISSPYIVIIDAETMQLHKRIKTDIMPLYGLQVSEDGEHFYCNSFKGFYIVNFDTGTVEASLSLKSLIYKQDRDQFFHVAAHTTVVNNFY